MEEMDGRQEKVGTMVDTLHRVFALIITGYPVFLPLLEQFKGELEDGLKQVAESLPKIAEVLSTMDYDTESTEKIRRKLVEAMPGLERLLPKMNS